MNNLRVLDINDALTEGTSPFRTLKGINIEFDDNGSAIYSCEKNLCLVKAYNDGKPVLLKINLNDVPQQEKEYGKLYLGTSLLKKELKVIDIRNREILTDVLIVDDEPAELLSFITPETENKEIISAFVKFLSALYTDLTVLDGLSFDNCFLIGDRILLSPLGKCETVYVGYSEPELEASFRNFTVNMLAELLLEIAGIRKADNDRIFRIGQNNFTDENIKLLHETGNKYAPFIDKLLNTSDRSELLVVLHEMCGNNNPENSYQTKGNYSEGRIAAIDKKTGKWGYLNLEGEVKIPFIYDEAGDFYENIAVVKKNGFYGSIDRDGKECIGFIFKELSWEGKYNVYVFKKKSLFGLIGRNKKIIIDESYLKIGGFNDGCAIVQSPENHLFGAVNSSGEIIIEPTYDKIEPFCEMKTTATKDGTTVVLDIFGDKI